MPTSRAAHSANRTIWRSSCGPETATDASLDALIRRYNGFVRLKASSYFLAGGDGEDLQQEGLIGLYKAIRDYRVDKDTSFRSFAELCITRQIITAIKGATRYKHGPLNGYVSFRHTPAGQDRRFRRLHHRRHAGRIERARPGEPRHLDRGARGPGRRARREPLEARGPGPGAVHGGRVVRDRSASALNCDAKAVDNALQRVKRKVGTHLDARE